MGQASRPETYRESLSLFFTTKAVGEGTGVGLSVSYGIVSQHGGDIWADSSAGEGTTFYVEIPVTSDEVVESPKPAASQGPISEIKRVLVVDDEPTIRALLSRSLELDGLKVDLAGDGEEAWRRLQTHPYDCIILDLKMPGMSGQQLYQAIGALGQELTKKVIFITGDTVSSETLDFIAEAGSPALTKPVDLDQLRQWVRSSLEPAGRSA
jgi:CheY-like chemotaxis protein